MIGDTATIGFTNLTGGSRVLFASGIVVTQSAEKVIADPARARGEDLEDRSGSASNWEDGAAHPASANAGQFEPLTLNELAAKAPATGGPIGARRRSSTPPAPTAASARISATSRSTRDTGIVRVLRYTAIQDVGSAIHPSYVEGQMQGGAAQGIGWALNEEYIYNKDGKVDNAGFLDYRMPVASDLPMIDASSSRCRTRSIRRASGASARCRWCRRWRRSPTPSTTRWALRFYSLPMSPPKVSAALDAGMKQAAE